MSRPGGRTTTRYPWPGRVKGWPTGPPKKKVWLTSGVPRLVLVLGSSRAHVVWRAPVARLETTHDVLVVVGSEAQQASWGGCRVAVPEGSGGWLRWVRDRLAPPSLVDRVGRDGALMEDLRSAELVVCDDRAGDPRPLAGVEVRAGAAGQAAVAALLLHEVERGGGTTWAPGAVLAAERRELEGRLRPAGQGTTP